MCQILDSIEPASKQPRKTPTILDGKYFKINQLGVNGQVNATCVMCERSVKGNISSTGNFLLHFKSKHASIQSEMTNYLKNKTDDANPSAKQTTLPDVFQPKSTEVFFFISFYTLLVKRYM